MRQGTSEVLAEEHPRCHVIKAAGAQRAQPILPIERIGATTFMLASFMCSPPPPNSWSGVSLGDSPALEDVPVLEVNLGRGAQFRAALDYAPVLRSN
jgi:hypothetical protein